MTCPVAGLNLIQPLFFLSWEGRRRYPVQNSKNNKVVYPIYDSRPPKPSLAAVIIVVTDPQTLITVAKETTVQPDR